MDHDAHNKYISLFKECYQEVLMEDLTPTIDDVLGCRSLHNRPFAPRHFAVFGVPVSTAQERLGERCLEVVDAVQ
jgi:hypothetical protein